ncbi:MAG: hypothetical protein U0794_10710 [Isosphaeraceae bacterium]
MSPKRYPCGGFHRRSFLAAAAAPVLASSLEGIRLVSAAEPRGAANPLRLAEELKGKLGIPGPYPGRVVEVKNPAMIRNGEKSRDAIAQTVSRGLKELTGADDVVEAWRTFFEPGDVVGIKMNPVGNPLANTNAELMLEVIEGLKSAGVKTNDIFVYERYRSEFIGAGMHKAVPDGIKWGD